MAQDVMVEPAAWSNMRYHFNEVEKKIEEEEIGRYEQYPLRLAWAITVHKSQGLTFNQVKIDFTGGVFAGRDRPMWPCPRCTSLEGISLQEPLRQSEVFVRNEVKQFARHYNDQSTINTALTQSKADKQYHDAVNGIRPGAICRRLSTTSSLPYTADTTSRSRLPSVSSAKS